MAYIKMKFITAMLLVTANSYWMGELKITSQKNWQLALLQKGSGQYILGKMALPPVF